MKANGLPALEKVIREFTEGSARFVIAISGFGGSGKTTVSDRLTKLFDATVIHIDDFIAADEKGAKPGFLHDWQRLEQEVFQPAKTQREIVSRIYDWQSNQQVFEKVIANQYLIIEGSAGLIQEKYASYFDLTVWLNVPVEVAHARGKLRDKVEQGVDHDELWDTVWGPTEKETFERTRPDKQADVLLDVDQSS